MYDMYNMPSTKYVKHGREAGIAGAQMNSGMVCVLQLLRTLHSKTCTSLSDNPNPSEWPFPTKRMPVKCSTQQTIPIGTHAGQMLYSTDHTSLSFVASLMVLKER
jgi:hypothetical protein